MLAFATRLLPDDDNPEENIFQNSNPEKQKTGYGMLSEGIDSVRLKNKVKITIISRGCKTTQAIPNIVCLYFTFTSRQDMK